MLLVCVGKQEFKSLPAWGVWIEIVVYAGMILPSLVAPRMGSVD